MKRTHIGFLFFILICSSLWGFDFDFGVLLNQYAGFGNSTGDENDFEYNAGIAPHAMFYFGDTGSFFTSASITVVYKEEFYVVPELLRTEFSIYFGGLGIKAGRFSYSDPFTFIAEGLFDGVQFTHSSGAGRFGLGAWYTGLLYKRSANIIMTSEDMKKYNAPLDYSDFADTYFAPRRFFAAIDWEHLSLLNVLQLNAAIIGQMDLSKEKEKYHSQYFALKIGIPVSRFLIEFGGSLEASQLEEISSEKQSNNKEYKHNLAFAGEFGIYWIPPPHNNSIFSLVARYASGDTNERLGAFVPFTAKLYGSIFQSKMTGITILTMDYSNRLTNLFGASINLSYFIRNDLSIPGNYYMAGEISNGNFLGGEIFTRFVWSPFSDLQLSLGAGIFTPAVGNVWKDGKPQWRIDLTAVMALY
ncbi:MAG: hypothetical protein LBQ93_10425 [Treponema sp.]|jgi:hypothetical protein|nr:hypothetical protein [Treponema sp.]